jgi:hypothetical protein
VPRPIPAAPRKNKIDDGVQAIARGAARFASQVLDRCAQAGARGATSCAPQVLDRGAQAVRCPRRRSLCVAGT